MSSRQRALSLTRTRRTAKPDRQSRRIATPPMLGCSSWFILPAYHTACGSVSALLPILRLHRFPRL